MSPRRRRQTRALSSIVDPVLGLVLILDPVPIPALILDPIPALILDPIPALIPVLIPVLVPARSRDGGGPGTGARCGCGLRRARWIS